MMKYIVFKDKSVDTLGTDKWPKGGQIITGSFWKEMAIVFAEELTHSIVAEQLKLIYPGFEVISAGFCSFSEDGWYCEGHSTSLNIGSRPMTDADVIYRSLWYDL